MEELGRKDRREQKEAVGSHKQSSVFGKGNDVSRPTSQQLWPHAQGQRAITQIKPTCELLNTEPSFTIVILRKL